MIFPNCTIFPILHTHIHTHTLRSCLPPVKIIDVGDKKQIHKGIRERKVQDCTVFLWYEVKIFMVGILLEMCPWHMVDAREQTPVSPGDICGDDKRGGHPHCQRSSKKLLSSSKVVIAGVAGGEDCLPPKADPPETQVLKGCSICLTRDLVQDANSEALS